MARRRQHARSETATRRRRVTTALAASAAVLVLTAVPVVGLQAGGRRVDRPAHLTAITPTPAGLASSRDLLLISAGHLDVVNATTGRTLRSVRIKGPTGRLGGPTIGPGNTVYANRGATLCRDTSIVAISMTTGRQQVIVHHAFGAVSPSRQYLAYVRYIAPPRRFGEPQSCATGSTNVRDLRTGAQRSWNITTTFSTGDDANQLIDSITWSTDSHYLVLTSLGDLSFRSLTQILDVDDRQSPANPAAVGGDIAYDSPILLKDGNLMGIVETCPNGASCPGQTPPLPPSTINVVRPASGGEVSSFQSDPGDVTLAIDPSGKRIEVLVAHRSDLTLDRLVGHNLEPTFHETDAQYGGFTWLPADVRLVPRAPRRHVVATASTQS